LRPIISCHTVNSLLSKSSNLIKLYREIIAVCLLDHIKHGNTLHGHILEGLVIKTGNGIFDTIHAMKAFGEVGV
jgi:hypothetical protein